MIQHGYIRALLVKRLQQQQQTRLDAEELVGKDSSEGASSAIPGSDTTGCAPDQNACLFLLLL